MYAGISISKMTYFWFLQNSDKGSIIKTLHRTSNGKNTKDISKDVLPIKLSYYIVQFPCVLFSPTEYIEFN